jgi:hypothetical protein
LRVYILGKANIESSALVGVITNKHTKEKKVLMGGGV